MGSQKTRVTQVDGLLRADGDDHIVGVRLDALEPHHLGDLLTESSGTPWPEPYCIATGPWCAISSPIARLTTSSGSPEMLGMPPASETTYGRDATAKSARISEAVIPAVRASFVPVDVGVEAVLRARRRGLHGGS